MAERPVTWLTLTLLGLLIVGAGKAVPPGQSGHAATAVVWHSVRSSQPFWPIGVSTNHSLVTTSKQCLITAERAPQQCKCLGSDPGQPFFDTVLKLFGSGEVHHSPAMRNGDPVADIFKLVIRKCHA